MGQGSSTNHDGMDDVFIPIPKVVTLILALIVGLGTVLIGVSFYR